ncbi:MAG TPA: LysR family transcriptional regulator [Trebonia sp.]|jgi:DNA-binding transcriptional LysR family regulator|nr:LysR family transcriptional regulator [Trebonia sp.]
MEIELRHLRAFAAVATQRSFSRAAEQLFITQPALTRTVRQLETLLGADLIDRGTHPVSLTPAGEEFLPFASRILNHLDTGVAAVRQHATIRLGFSWLLPDPWAQHAVTGFEQATGDSVTLIRSDDPLAAIDEGTIDVALVRGAIAGSQARRVVHLFDETRVAVCAVGYELPAGELPAGGDGLDWHDTPGWTLVVNTVSGTTGPWSWPDGAGPRRIVPTANFDEWVESVAAGRGIGIVPDVARRRSIHPGVRFIPLRNAPASPVSLVFRPGIREPLLRRFVQAALAAVETMAAG